MSAPPTPSGSSANPWLLRDIRGADAEAIIAALPAAAASYPYPRYYLPLARSQQQHFHCACRPAIAATAPRPAGHCRGQRLPRQGPMDRPRPERLGGAAFDRRYVWHACWVARRASKLIFSPSTSALIRSASPSNCLALAALAAPCALESIYCYCASAPPSMTNSAPVIYEESSEARNKTPATISATAPMRPSGTRPQALIQHLRIRHGAVQHLRVDRTRMHGVATNAVLGVLGGRDFGKNTHGALARRVGRLLMHRLANARNGGNVDDRAAASAAHRWNGVLRAEKNALGVHRHDAVPLLLRALLNRHARNDDAGVVDQNIELAKAAHRRLHGPLPVRFAGDVEMYIDRLTARRADVGLDLRSGLVQEIAKHHLRALLDEGFGL